MSTKRSAKAEEILDAAEAHMRRGGFDAVSYRVLATEVGIKSASVHYHFPQKSDLGRVVVERYAQRFLASLGRPDDPDESPRDRLQRLADGYADSLSQHGTVCLCCVLGAERRYLPDNVAEAVTDFYRRLLDWVTTALKPSQAGDADEGTTESVAAHVISSLQGAMVLAVTMNQDELIHQTATHLAASLPLS